MGAFLLFLCLLAPFILACAVRGRRRPAGASPSARGGRGSLPLPPGSMGWPYVGETFQLYSSKNPNVFFARKRNKYGPIFKTNILGCPCVMVSSPEAARFVLVTQAHLFKPTFPASKERMLGPQAIFFQQGDYHAHLRRLVSRAFSPEAIRASVPAIEAIALRSLGSWDGRFVNTFQEMKTYALNVALLSIFGDEEMRYMEELKQCYLTLEKGYNSLPVNLPGTLFHKAMKARKRLGAIVAHIISARRERQRGSDLLGSFVDGREALTDAQIADNVIGVIFAARDTTASVLTWMVKFLGDHPSVLKAVTEEQEEIAREKESSGEPLSWADTRRMRMTSRVIQETMRVASILSFTFREAVEDVEYQGEQRRHYIPVSVSSSVAAPSLSGQQLAAANELDGMDASLTEKKKKKGETLLSSNRLTQLDSSVASCRVPDPQGLESASPVPQHPPQPRPLPLPGQVRPFPIRGGAQAQHVHAVRQRDPLVPRQRARQAGDARPLPPPRHQVQVVHLQVRERRAVRPLRAAAQRSAHELHPQGR